MVIISPYLGTISPFFLSKRALLMGINGGRESMVRDILYNNHFGVKNDDIGPESTYYWNIYDE